MKTNFKKSKKSLKKDLAINDNLTNDSNKELTQKEFEEFIIKSGAKGSFMVYRSEKEDEELGIDEL